MILLFTLFDLCYIIWLNKVCSKLKAILEDETMFDFLAKIFFIFFIYSVGGWIVETIKVSLCEKKFVNRGFLFGPYCPIYGVGALILYIFLDSLTDRPFLYFFVSIVIAGTLEYVTHYVQEKKYHARWWDYSNKAFNLNGRICLENLLQFGIFGTIFMCYVNKHIVDLFFKMSCPHRDYIMLTLFIIVMADNLISKILIKKIKSDIETIKGDSTYEVSKKLESLIKESNPIRRRLFNAYPGLKQNRIKEAIKQGEENFDKRIKELEEKVKSLEEKLKNSK